MSYHQVPSCNLHLLGLYGRFGGIIRSNGAFIGRSHLRVPSTAFPTLKRSELYIEMTYSLKSTQYHQPSEYTRRSREEEVEQEANWKSFVFDWESREVIIHHRFDVLHGTMLWFVTTSHEQRRSQGKWLKQSEATMWTRVLGPMLNQQYDAGRLSSPRTAFEASLKAHLRIAQWSLGSSYDYVIFVEHLLDGKVSISCQLQYST